MEVPAKSHEDIDAQIRDLQVKRKTLVEEPDKQTAVGLDSTGYYDQEIYGGSDSRFKGYVTSIAANEQEEDDDDIGPAPLIGGGNRQAYHPPAALLNDIPQAAEMIDPFAEHRAPRIADREDEYRARRRQLIISPERVDPFADAGTALTYQAEKVHCKQRLDG
uniref:splicing factor 3B subunit 1 isoform X3 n=1 Tax=Myxine glutinosa TaxID=7769 RepID=UPI00358E0A74